MGANPHLLKLLVRTLWEVSLGDLRKVFRSLLVPLGAPLCWVWELTRHSAGCHHGAWAHCSPSTEPRVQDGQQRWLRVCAGSR